MPFIKRNENNAIASLSQKQDTDHTEYLPATSSEVIEFISILQETSEAQMFLGASDRELARIGEDLIYLLIKKNIILLTDFPPAVQEKLLGREKLRFVATGGDNTLLEEKGVI